MRKKVASIYKAGEWLDLYDDGCIGRPQIKMPPSGQWKVTGAVTRNNFGHVTARFTLEEIIERKRDIPWQHANGSQKTFITDLDHGTHREWRSPTPYYVTEPLD